MSEKATEALDELELKKIELDSLIDIIKSINGNIPEQDLYRTFMFTLSSYPHISKMTLYVLDEDTEVDASRNKWFNKEGFGTLGNYRDVLFSLDIFQLFVHTILRLTPILRSSRARMRVSSSDLKVRTNFYGPGGKNPTSICPPP